MLLKFFKQTLPQVIITIITLAILLWLRSFLSNQISPFYFESISVPLFTIVSNWLSTNILWGRIVTFIMLLFTGFYLLHINSKHIVVKQRTYLISFFYIILISSLPQIQQLNPSVFAAFFVVFAIDHLLSIYHKDQVLDDLFKAGFFIAIASLFYAPSIFYFAAIIFSIISIRSFNIREWFAAIFGLITPLFFYLLYSAFILFKLNLVTEVNNIQSTMLYSYYAFCSLLFITTGFFLVKTLPNQKINVRKFHGVFFWFNLTSILIIVLVPCVSIEFAYIAIIPIVFQYTHYFTISTKRFWPNFLFTVFFVFAFLMHLFPSEF